MIHLNIIYATRVTNQLNVSHHLSDAHQLKCWTCELTLGLVMHSIATMNSITHYVLAHIITGEYVVRYTYHFVISESNITTKCVTWC